MTTKELLEKYEAGEFTQYLDMTYGIKKMRPKLYTKFIDGYTKITLEDLVQDTSTGKKYLVFKTIEQEIGGKDLHITEWNDHTIQIIFEKNPLEIATLKNTMRNMNRWAQDSGYEDLQDFLKKFNEVMEEYPEEFI